jgi:predicted RNA binding protein YcfA (HicA-like mRNA interferase family)
LGVLVHSREIIRILLREGWIQTGRKGSHVQFEHPGKPGKVTVPHPKRDMPIGTLKGIERQSGLKFR